MAIEKDYGNTNFITGMRAWAAFGVLLIHAGGAGLDALGMFGIHIIEFGRTGVYAFFVISGFSISATCQGSASYFQYLNRRLWRIAPIYYFWLAAAILTGFAPIAGNPVGLTEIDAKNIWLHLSFLSFTDYTVTNSILGVEWSISIEVFWYFLALLLLFVMRGKVLVAVAVVASLWAYWRLTEYPTNLPWLPTTWVQDKYDIGLAMHWSPLPYVASYCMGIAAFRVRQMLPDLQRYGDAAFIGVAMLCALFFSRREWVLSVAYDEVLFASAVTAGLIVFGGKSSRLYRWIFGSKAAVFLGTISYGVYLPQFLILAVLRWYLPNGSPEIFVAAAVLSVMVFYLMYRLLEVPALRFGTSLGQRRQLSP